MGIVIQSDAIPETKRNPVDAETAELALATLKS